jgi:ribonuclease P protein component
MERALRLTYDADFRRVRTRGKSWAHPFAILCALPNNLPHNRYGFSVSKRIGGAVVRNRVKRLLREAVRTTTQEVGPLVSGYDVILIARPPIVGRTYAEVCEIVRALLRRAKLLLPPAVSAAQEAQPA